MKTSPRPKKTQHPLSGSTLGNWLALLIQNGGVSRSHFPKALNVTGMILASAPIRLLEALRYNQQIQQTEISEPPIFILGHWRSGTTYLHRMMVQDERWGYVSSLQAFVPEAFVTLKQMMAFSLKGLWPEVRPMDNVSYSPEVPEEEDYSLACISPFSFYCSWYFPQQMQGIFRRSVLLQDLSQAESQQWQRSYLKVLKKTTLFSGGKQLVIKNPSNTARISELLKLFPEAKFIHIYRNPYDVYTSTMKFYKKLVPNYALQTFNESEFEDNIFLFYKLLMDVFFDTVELIPPENFVEIRYEDFENAEVTCMEHIYKSLSLPGFEQVKSEFQAYVADQAGYQKNEYILDEATKARVYSHWQKAIDWWTALPQINQAVS
jgi:omega-hydroxy-beta-dihydromenaquinone-9 sulfotransferase